MTSKKTGERIKDGFMEEVMRTMPVMCYAEIAELGAGVDLVRHIETGRIAVRKRYPPDMRRVCECLKKEKLPGIPKILEICEENEELVIIEEYVQGMTLRDYLERYGPLPANRAAFCTAVLASVLEECHHLTPPVVHRDVKPENVILTESRLFYIVDFGAAKIVSEGEERDANLQGTPGYAAPEQYGFAPSGPAADVYALGILFYEMIGANNGNSAPLRVGKVIRKATSALPENRFCDAGELKRAILTCLPPEMLNIFLAGEFYHKSVNRTKKGDKNGICGGSLLRDSGGF